VFASTSIPREDEGYSRARVIKRSRLYFTFPVIIISAILINFIWEIIRTNLGAHAVTSWPFRFTIIDASDTATILAVFVSLFMGRLQWARSLRPIAGIAIDDEGSQFLPDSDMWRVWIYNAGPGTAMIEEITYFVRFMDQSDGDGVINWVPLSIINDQLQSRGLMDGRDYFIRWYAKGAPFPSAQRYSEGMQLAWFTVTALAQFRIFDVRVRYLDSLGDVHERNIPVMHRLPSVTIRAIKAHLAAGSVSP
jgi:hypothetical protein